MTAYDLYRLAPLSGITATDLVEVSADVFGWVRPRMIVKKVEECAWVVKVKNGGEPDTDSGPVTGPDSKNFILKSGHRGPDRAWVMVVSGRDLIVPDREEGIELINARGIVSTSGGLMGVELPGRSG